MKKKIMLVIVTFVIASLLLFVGCNNQKRTNVSTEEQNYLLELAQNAESSEDVFSVLEKNDSEEMQIKLAKVDNSIVQKSLLNYNDLTTDALITICENPHPSLNLKSEANKNYFIDAISKAELNEEEEIRIAETKEYAMQIGILFRKNISAEALIYIIKTNNNEFNWVINLENSEIKKCIYQQILQIDLTLKQRQKLENIDVSYISQALEAREMK